MASIGTEESVARHLSLTLDMVADRLSAAGDARAFVRALDANRTLWSDISMAAPRFGWRLPAGAADFAMTASGRGAYRIDDHEVEALIRLNRRIARAFLEGRGKPAAA